MKNNTNQPAVGQRPKSRSIQTHLDAMSPSDGSLALALLKLDDESYRLRRSLPLAHAREIAEGRTKWPPSLIGFKTLVELRHYHSAGPKPPWIDRTPSRPCKRDRARAIQRGIQRRRAA